MEKVLKLRIFADDAGKMNRSVQDIGGGLFIVSQFTLAADTSSGNSAGFSGAAPAALGGAVHDLLQLHASCIRSSKPVCSAPTCRFTW